MIARLIVSFLLSLIVPVVGLLEFEFNLGLRYDTFPGNVMVLLERPGYQCAALLFRERARSESAGILLFPAASLFNIVLYTIAILRGHVVDLIKKGAKEEKIGRHDTTSTGVTAIDLVGAERDMDFEPFLSNSQNPMIRAYLDPEKFGDFRLEHGDLIWDD